MRFKQQENVPLHDRQMGREKIVTVPNPDKEGHHQDSTEAGPLSVAPGSNYLLGTFGMRQGSGSQESTCTRVSAVRTHRVYGTMTLIL